MHAAIFHHATATKLRVQATYLLPGHGSGTRTPASNDESWVRKESVLKIAMSVLANAISGAILLAAMFNLPIILAVIWDI